MKLGSARGLLKGARILRDVGSGRLPHAGWSFPRLTSLGGASHLP